MGTPGSLSSPPKARCAMVGPLCALFSRFLHHSSPSALPAPPPSAPPPRPPPPAAVATGESGERRRVRRRGCKPHLATIPRPAIPPRLTVRASARRGGGRLTLAPMPTLTLLIGRRAQQKCQPVCVFMRYPL
jgi:hypothetical protein